MKYEITVDDSLVAGLIDQLETTNAQARVQRKPFLASVEDLLTQASIGLAQQGLNNIAERQAALMSQVVMNNAALDPTATIKALSAFAVASPETQLQVKTLLGI